MRNYADTKIVLTSGTDVEELLHQYSLNVAPVIPVQHAEAGAPTYRPPAKFQVQIYRDGKSSESVSFIREALADSGRRHSAAPGEGFSQVDEDHKSDEGAISESSAASKNEGDAAHASNSRGPTLPPSETGPADQSA